MKKLSLSAMISLARERGGCCLSSLYRNAATALLWQCTAGHQWNAVPWSIRKGTWCPDCAGVRRLTLEHMKKLAAAHRGMCLSKSYQNGSSKLQWRCSAGHTWSATPNQVQKGHWCPFCARVARMSLPATDRGREGRPLCFVCVHHEKGGIVPSTGVALLHAKEMVLPAQISEKIQNSTPMGDSRPVHFHYTANVNALNAAGVEDALKNHGDFLATTMMRSLRRRNVL